MTETIEYSIELEPCAGALDLVDLPELVGANTKPWFNQTICRVNDCVVRLGIVHGDFHWHKHDHEDEFFYVVSGRLIIDIEEGDSIGLSPGQGTLVPRTVVHRPRAPEKTVMLMFEGAGVMPTGDPD
ncbi:MAG TPA: cupin domain-containing protein [Chloroflexota bacterium]|nr:cupin domain-containing protein [Chloroflexota bacterium]